MARTDCIFLKSFFHTQVQTITSGIKISSSGHGVIANALLQTRVWKAWRRRAIIRQRYCFTLKYGITDIYDKEIWRIYLRSVIRFHRRLSVRTSAGDKDATQK